MPNETPAAPGRGRELRRLVDRVMADRAITGTRPRLPRTTSWTRSSLLDRQRPELRPSRRRRRSRRPAAPRCSARPTPRAPPRRAPSAVNGVGIAIHRPLTVSRANALLSILRTWTTRHRAAPVRCLPPPRRRHHCRPTPRRALPRSRLRRSDRTKAGAMWRTSRLALEDLKVELVEHDATSARWIARLDVHCRPGGRWSTTSTPTISVGTG